MTFRYLSVCSGLEGASLAFETLGATPVGFAEIEAFPSAIIAHHYGSNLPGQPLSHNAPPNFGDFTTIDTGPLGAVDVLIGGTPCQAFSVAGKRLSLSDARGNLTLAYAVLAHELAGLNGLRNCIWENVPGVLSAKDNAFGCFLGVIVGADDALHTPDGGSWPDAGMVAGPRARAAWRVLNAQYFGLAQRRRRVFLVADFGNGADPAAVLFEPAGVRRNSPSRREQREGIAPTLAARARGGGGLGTDFDCDGGLIPSTGDIAHCLNAGAMGRLDYESETLVACDIADSLTVGANQTTGFVGDVVAHALRGEGFDASEDGTGRGTPLVPVAFDLRGREGGAQFEGPHQTANIRAASGGSSRSYVAFVQNTRDEVRMQGGDGDIVGAQSADPGAKQQTYLAQAFNWQSGGDCRGLQLSSTSMALTKEQTPALLQRGNAWAVRRLTPEECEKLQGVPEGYTRIPWRGKTAEQCPDGPRYKALGNSWAVPVVRWIGERLAREIGHKP